MATATPTSQKLPIDAKTMAEAYLRRIQNSANERFYLWRKDGRYAPVKWQEAHNKILGIFAGLKRAGISKGDKVCIISQTRPEWILCDLANFSLGAVSVPIYPSNLADTIGFILENCEAKFIFAEDRSQCEKLSQIFRQVGKTLPVVCFSPNGKEVKDFEVTPFEEFVKVDLDEAIQTEFEKNALAVKPEDTASIVYTSGTTGQPKGVVLSHHNFVSGLRAAIQAMELVDKDITVTFLPFSHIYGRIEGLASVFCSLTLGFAQSLTTVAQDVQDLKPTVLVGVPRIYEKIFDKVQAELELVPKFQKQLFLWAAGMGREAVRRRSEKQPVPLRLAFKEKVAYQLVLNKINAKLGGNLRLSITGGAPLSPDLCEFFHACRVPIVEGYGLTETLGPIIANPPSEPRFGTVGKPLESAKVRIAEDGEIFLKGDMVFNDYYRNPEATQEAFSEDGWFKTGDIGTIDDRGYLRITDRKKEIIVTAGGKNIAPQRLENMIKGIRWVSNCMVYGDRKKYLTAVITLNEADTVNYAKASGISFATFEELVGKNEIIHLIQKALEPINGQLAKYETIKKFRILPRDFTVESGELTPSLKIKRKIICSKFKNFIDMMY